jgi:uncharacterized protein YjdB
MKDKTFFRSLKAVLLLMAVIATSCIPMNMSLDNAVIAEAATKIKLNKTKITLHVGYANEETYQLKITGTNKKAKWSTSNKNIATVSQKGKVTAIKIGKAVITAKVNGKELKCNVIVKKGSANNQENTPQISISGSRYIYVGGYGQLKAVSSISNNKKINWASSDPNIVTVNNGSVYGVSPGTAIITASIGNAKAMRKVTVLEYNTIISVDCANTITINQNDYKVINVTTDMGSGLAYNISDNNIISAKWGIKNELSADLTVKAEKKGTADIIIYDTHNPDLNKKITVFVKESIINNPDTSEPTTNKPASAFDQLYKIISNSKLIDDDGNHFISYSLDDWTFNLTYNEKIKKFEFTSIPDDHETLITIYIDRNGSQKALIDFFYFNSDTSIDCHGTGYLSVNSHTETTEINFNFDAGDYHFLEAYKRIANIDVRLCLLGIQKLLQNNTNITLYDLGFLKF